MSGFRQGLTPQEQSYLNSTYATVPESGTPATALIDGIIAVDASNPKYGTTFDQAQINLAIQDAAAAGLPAVHVPKAKGPWTIKRAVSTSQAGGIRLASGVSVLSDYAELVLNDNCSFIWGSGTLGTAANVTADVAAGALTLTVDSTASLAVGGTVYFRLGDISTDTAEAVNYGFATVTAIPSATSVTLDTPIEVAVTIASTTNNKQIYPCTPLEDLEIGSFFCNSNGTTANAEEGITLGYARNIHVRPMRGVNVGAGLLNTQYCEAITFDSLKVDGCVQQGGEASKGRILSCAETQGLRGGLVDAIGCQGNPIFIEAGCRGLHVALTRIADTSNPNSVNSEIFVGEGSQAHFEVVDLVCMTGARSLVDSGGTTAFASLGIVRLGPNMPQSIGAPYRQIVLPGEASFGPVTKHWTGVFSLTASMAGTWRPMASGVFRSLSVYCPDAADITGLYISDGTHTVETHASLVAGQTVRIPVDFGLNYGWNSHGTTKEVTFYTTSTIPANSYIVLDVEYYVDLSGDDLSRGGGVVLISPDGNQWRPIAATGGAVTYVST